MMGDQSVRRTLRSIWKALVAATKSPDYTKESKRKWRWVGPRGLVLCSQSEEGGREGRTGPDVSLQFRLLFLGYFLLLGLWPL